MRFLNKGINTISEKALMKIQKYNDILNRIKTLRFWDSVIALWGLHILFPSLLCYVKYLVDLRSGIDILGKSKLQAVGALPK